MLKHLQFSIDLLIRQTNKFKIKSYLIVVEWSHGPGNDIISSKFQIYSQPEFPTVKVGSVLSEVYGMYKGSGDYGHMLCT